MRPLLSTSFLLQGFSFLHPNILLLKYSIILEIIKISKFYYKPFIFFIPGGIVWTIEIGLPDKVLYREKNITKAAKELFISQPALTHKTAADGEGIPCSDREQRTPRSSIYTAGRIFK